MTNDFQSAATAIKLCGIGSTSKLQDTSAFLAPRACYMVDAHTWIPDFSPFSSAMSRQSKFRSEAKSESVFCQALCHIDGMGLHTAKVGTLVGQGMRLEAEERVFLESKPTEKGDPVHHYRNM